MLSLPNILTLSRILAVPSTVPALARRGRVRICEPIDYALAFGLYCLMGITDYFDIMLHAGIVSGWSALPHPIADKIMIAAGYCCWFYPRHRGLSSSRR